MWDRCEIHWLRERRSDSNGTSAGNRHLIIVDGIKSGPIVNEMLTYCPYHQQNIICPLSNILWWTSITRRDLHNANNRGCRRGDNYGSHIQVVSPAWPISAWSDPSSGTIYVVGEDVHRQCIGHTGGAAADVHLFWSCSAAFPSCGARRACPVWFFTNQVTTMRC